MYDCLYLCTVYVPEVWGGKKRALDPLELELLPDVMGHVGAGNETRSAARNVLDH